MIFKNVQFQSVGETEEREDGSVLLKRVPESVRSKLNERAQQMMLISGNNEIRFVSESDEIRITLSLEFTDFLSDESTMVKGVVFWGDFQTQQELIIQKKAETFVIKKNPRLKALPQKFEKGNTFSKDVCRILIGMQSACLVFHNIEGEGIRPPNHEELPSKTLLAYGTSITHGCASSYPHLNFSAICSRHLGLDLINLGSGGSAQCEPELADYIAELGKEGKWDIASLGLCVNMIFMPEKDFYDRTTRFVKTIAESNPDKPVFCITVDSKYKCNTFKVKMNGLTAIVTFSITTKKGVAMYQQLTQEKRYILYAFKQEGFSMRKIAKHLDVNASTISRELRRNRKKRGYRPGLANRIAMSRRKTCRKPEKLTSEIKHLLSSYLKKHWSPEQIAGRLKLEGILEISHETIYKYIRQNKDNGGKLYKCLRRKKAYRKRYGSLSRHKLDSRRSIDERPEIVNKKKRIGDWEVDTMVSKKDKAVLLTMVDRVSKYALIGTVGSKDSTLVGKRIRDLFRKQKNKVHTITADNGTEFAGHKIVAQKLDAHFFFAHPYCSWERGLNENTNGLIRQYFPKKSSFKNVTEDRLKQVMSNINNRPRKTLGYRTPNEVFNSQGVALDG